jgi:LacI family transcriptional regulator
VALIGSCNELVVASAGNPSLSSIDFGYERIGHRAAALLDSLMDGSPAPTKPIYVVPAALVTRQSSDAFVVGDPMVAMALRFITEHVHTGVHVEQVAAHVATTRRTLARRFHSCLGRSIHESITQLRIDQVKRHLIESHAALKTVAAACGFRDAIHMCKVFQRIEGTSPSDYRTARTMRDK